MSKPPAAGGAVKKIPDMNPLVYADLVEKELLRQREFGKVWGELSKTSVPKTLEEAAALKHAEIAELSAKLPPGTAKSVTYTTNIMGTYPSVPNHAHLEAGLGKAYKVLRAGI
jgi:hypothetical protein